MSDPESDSTPLLGIDAEGFDTAADFISRIGRPGAISDSSNLNIILGALDADYDNLIRQFENYNWKVKDDLGIVKRISHEYTKQGRKRNAEGYLLFYEDEGYFSFYTPQAKTEEVKYGIDEFLRNCPSVTYLYLPPQTLYNMASELYHNFDGKIREFISKNPHETFNHYGENGFERLDEFQSQFHALPHNLVIDASAMRFRVDTAGRFKLIKGSLLELLEWVNYCARQSLNIRDEHRQSGYDIVDVSPDDAPSQNMRFSDPAIIEHTKPLSYDEAATYEKKFADADRDYALLDYHVEKGSVYLNGTVYDPETNTSFRIRGNQEETRILPMENQSLKSFYRFVEFYQSSVKTDATIRPGENELS